MILIAIQVEAAEIEMQVLSTHEKGLNFCLASIYCYVANSRNHMKINNNKGKDNDNKKNRFGQLNTFTREGNVNIILLTF